MLAVPAIVGIRLAGMALALSSSGCALLLQEHLPARYNPREEEPHCSASSGLAVIDSVFSGLSLAAAYAATKVDTQDDPDAKRQRDIYIASAILGAAVHTVSGFAGFEWASECEKARVQRAAFMKEQFADRPAPRRRSFFRKQARPLSGNGFFCSSIGCSRDLESCESNRIADEQPCAPQRTAFCFGNARYRVCRPSMAACERQLDVSGYGSQSTCDEMR